MPAFIKTKEDERAWKRAKGIAKKQYPGMDKGDSGKFYAIVTTIYKSICLSSHYSCSRLGESMGTMADLIEAKMKPHLNKADPGSLLGAVVYLLEKEGLEDVAKKVRIVSKDVSDAWKMRDSK